MMKIIISSALTSSFLRYTCHTDPERLSVLSEEAHKQGKAGLDLVKDFTDILDDIRIDGVWKRTFPSRLPCTEALFAKYLDFNNLGLQLLDVGSSDGCTTHDLANYLREAGHNKLNIYLSDRHLYLLRFGTGLVKEYRANDGTPVLVRFGKLGLRLPDSEHKWDGISTLLSKLYLKCTAFRKSLTKTKTLSMISPSAASDHALTPLELDCLKQDTKLINRLNGVRASNILNLNYFSTIQLQFAVQHFVSYLKENGILIISRNVMEYTGEIEHGTAWKKRSDGHLEQLETFGSGSEIAHIVNSITFT